MPDILVTILSVICSMFGVIFGFAYFAENDDKDTKSRLGAFSSVLLLIGIPCIVWIWLATPFHQEYVAQVYQMDNQIIKPGTEIEHQYYFGIVNSKGVKVNVTGMFDHTDVDPSKYEVVEIFKEGFSDGIIWVQRPEELKLRLKTTVETK